MNAIAFQVQILGALLVTEDKESIIISNLPGEASAKE